MAGFLTTHVLDTASGRPAAGMRVELFRIEGEERAPLKDAVTNADGRTDEPLLTEDEFGAATFEIVFHVGGILRGGWRAAVSGQTSRSGSASPTRPPTTTCRS